MGWTVLPYSLDLASSDFHLFGPLKNAIRGRHFEDDDEVIDAVKTWLCRQSTEFYRQGLHALLLRWSTAVERAGDYVAK